MKKITTLFALIILISCGDKPEDVREQLAALSPCTNTDLGITEASRHPWPTDPGSMINQSENVWHWKKSNDTLYVFMSQWGIDSKITEEYAFMAKPGTCLEPIRYSFRDTYDEWSTNATEPIIYTGPFTGEVQYYVENALYAGRLLPKNSNRHQDIWVDFNAGNERPGYDIRNMGNQ